MPAIITYQYYDALRVRREARLNVNPDIAEIARTIYENAGYKNVKVYYTSSAIIDIDAIIDNPECDCDYCKRYGVNTAVMGGF